MMESNNRKGMSFSIIENEILARLQNEDIVVTDPQGELYKEIVLNEKQECNFKHRFKEEA